MIGQLRDGDVVVVWKLDRLSRSLKDMLHIMERIELAGAGRSEEHTSELQSLMRISYAVFCLKKKKKTQKQNKPIKCSNKTKKENMSICNTIKDNTYTSCHNSEYGTKSSSHEQQYSHGPIIYS